MKPNHQNIFCGLLMIAICAATVSCKKARDAAPSGPAIPVDTASNPVDPQTAATIGFFLDAWKPRTFIAPANSKDTIPFSGKADVTITIDMNKVVTKVSPCLFGNNANTWMGQVITEPALIQYIKDLSPHIIRAPGGSISDVYFWNQSSAPPPDVPDSLFDASGHKVPVGYWYGGNTASWTLSLKNYYTLLQQTVSTGILTVNYAYARYGTGPHPYKPPHTWRQTGSGMTTAAPNIGK